MDEVRFIKISGEKFNELKNAEQLDENAFYLADDEQKEIVINEETINRNIL